MEAIASRLEASLLGSRPSPSRLEAIALRLEAFVSRLEAIASRLEAIASRLEAIASRLEAMASRLEAIASRLEAIALRNKDKMSRFHSKKRPTFPGNSCHIPSIGPKLNEPGEVK